MNKLLLIAFFFCSAIAFGQGAASPDLAWDNGTPNGFWFEMDVDSDGSAWVSKDPSSKLIELNNIAVGYIENAALVSAHDQLTYDEGWFNWSFGAGYVIDDNFSYFGYEEWFVIKVPSSGNLKITLDISDNLVDDTKTATSFQWYEFDVNPAEIGIAEYPINLATGIKGWTEWSVDDDFMEFDISTEITKKYVLIRIGNNSAWDGTEIGGGPFITSYKIKVSTNNNRCQNSLHFPVNTVPFGSTTDNTVKDLLDNSDEISVSYYSNNKHLTIEGDDDLSLGNGSPGLWFEVTDIVDPLFVATCGTGFDAQLLVFREGCPISETGSGRIIGAEDQNFNTDLNGIAAERTICTDAPNNYDLPVLNLVDPATTYSTTSLYIYLFGDGVMGLFDLYVINGLSGILPVEWLVFEGYSNNSFNQLIWSTASEDQNDYFIIEKSADGENYSELGRIEGAGNSAFENSYSLIDRTPFYLTYYRVSQVDFNGTTSSGPQIVVKNESIFFQCSILNQPISNGLLQISIIAAEEMDVELSILSLGGQELIKVKYSLVENENNINVSINSLTNGVYILTINTTNRQITKKIIVQSLN